jgi:NADH dehydrogenase FAD-containing subunit
MWRLLKFSSDKLTTYLQPINKTVTLSNTLSIKGQLSTTTILYDYLVMTVGAKTQAFGIPDVQDHAVFMKELHNAKRFQGQFIDCVKSTAFPGQSPEEVDRLLHAVVVGGGLIGIELSGELHDFFVTSATWNLPRGPNWGHQAYPTEYSQGQLAEGLGEAKTNRERKARGLC